MPIFEDFSKKFQKVVALFPFRSYKCVKDKKEGMKHDPTSVAYTNQR